MPCLGDRRWMVFTISVVVYKGTRTVWVTWRTVDWLSEPGTSVAFFCELENVDWDSVSCRNRISNAQDAGLVKLHCCFQSLGLQECNGTPSRSFVGKGEEMTWKLIFFKYLIIIGHFPTKTNHGELLTRLLESQRRVRDETQLSLKSELRRLTSEFGARVDSNARPD